MVSLLIPKVFLSSLGSSQCSKKWWKFQEGNRWWQYSRYPRKRFSVREEDKNTPINCSLLYSSSGTCLSLLASKNSLGTWCHIPCYTDGRGQAVGSSSTWKGGMAQWTAKNIIQNYCCFWGLTSMRDIICKLGGCMSGPSRRAGTGSGYQQVALSAASWPCAHPAPWGAPAGAGALPPLPGACLWPWCKYDAPA